MVTDSASPFAKDADAMGFVHHDAGIILLGKSYDFADIGDIAFHGKDAVADDQLDFVRIAFLELLFERLHVVVFVFELLAE